MAIQPLKPEYQQHFAALKEAIQESEELETYLDSGEADDYTAFKDTYEPDIAAAYETIAAGDPLQLQAVELELLDTGFEGLYLPKVLGFAVLRPLVSERGQYYRPQEHLKQVILAIAHSSAFPELERRVGQGITVAFALSTHVWVTNLIAEVPNKLPRNFLTEHHDLTIRTEAKRLEVYNRYKRQFRTENFATAAFPTDTEELATSYRALEGFLRKRFGNPELDNSALDEPISKMLARTEFEGSPDFERFISLVAMFMELPKEMENSMRTRMRNLAGDGEYAERFFKLLAELHHDPDVNITPEVDKRMSLRVGTGGETLMSQYYNLVNKIHASGINTLETQDAIQLFTREQEGTSEVNECVRQTVLRYLRELLLSLDVERYGEFFEATKLFAVHFGIFDNEAFKQEIRILSVNFVKQTMKRYTDKRGRDYQDIKKFVKTSFVDLGFMSEREITNFFKTKRKRRPTPTE